MSCKDELLQFSRKLNSAIINSENVENRLPNLGGGFIKISHSLKIFISELRNLSFKVSNDLKHLFNYNESVNINELIQILKNDSNNKIKATRIHDYLISVIDDDVETIDSISQWLYHSCEIYYDISGIVLIWNKIVDDILDDESKL